MELIKKLNSPLFIDESVSAEIINIDERLEQINNYIVESAVWRAMKAQASYYKANKEFASSIDLLDIEASSDHYSLNIQILTKEQSIIESVPINKEKNSLYFIGVMNIEPKNNFFFLFQATKPYSEMNSIEELFERDFYIPEKV